MVVPDVKSIWNAMDDDYINFVGDSADKWWRASGAELPAVRRYSRQAVFETILRCHGHQAAYTPDLLLTFLSAAGFIARPEMYGCSEHTPLRGIDLHWKLMGLDRVILESVVAEGTK